MLTRGFIFIAALLLLPAAGLFLSGAQWSDLAARALSGDATLINPPSTMLTTLMMFGYLIFINYVHKILSGRQVFQGQMPYVFQVAAASALLGWLLAYLNLYVASWTTQAGNPLLQTLLYTPLFALLAPAVLYTRACLAAVPGVLSRCSSRITFSLDTPRAIYVLIALSALGLAGGAAWPASLYPLLWFAPLALLVALQFLWHESTIFSGLKSGDYGRVICSALAGILVGNFAMVAYKSNGGLLGIHATLFMQLGLLLFGWLCMQLADVIAEHSRGKKRDEIFPEKKFSGKKFTIPVVVKPK